MNNREKEREIEREKNTEREQLNKKNESMEELINFLVFLKM